MKLLYTWFLASQPAVERPFRSATASNHLKTEDQFHGSQCESASLQKLGGKLNLWQSSAVFFSGKHCGDEDGHNFAVAPCDMLLCESNPLSWSPCAASHTDQSICSAEKHKGFTSLPSVSQHFHEQQKGTRDRKMPMCPRTCYQIYVTMCLGPYLPAGPTERANVDAQFETLPCSTLSVSMRNAMGIRKGQLLHFRPEVSLCISHLRFVAEFNPNVVNNECVIGSKQGEAHPGNIRLVQSLVERLCWIVALWNQLVHVAGQPKHLPNRADAGWAQPNMSASVCVAWIHATLRLEDMEWEQLMRHSQPCLQYFSFRYFDTSGCALCERPPTDTLHTLTCSISTLILMTPSEGTSRNLSWISCRDLIPFSLVWTCAESMVVWDWELGNTSLRLIRIWRKESWATCIGQLGSANWEENRWGLWWIWPCWAGLPHPPEAWFSL